jgi:hypothetical protein
MKVVAKAINTMIVKTVVEMMPMSRPPLDALRHGAEATAGAAPMNPFTQVRRRQGFSKFQNRD